MNALRKFAGTLRFTSVLCAVAFWMNVFSVVFSGMLCFFDPSPWRLVGVLNAWIAYRLWYLNKEGRLL